MFSSFHTITHFFPNHSNRTHCEGLARPNMWPTFTGFCSLAQIINKSFKITRWPNSMIFTSNELNLDVCQLLVVYWNRPNLDSTVNGWVSTLPYLSRPTYFHLVHIDGVVGPAAVVVKLDISGHALHLDLPGRTDRLMGMCNNHHFAFIAGIKVLAPMERPECA